MFDRNSKSGLITNKLYRSKSRLPLEYQEVSFIKSTGTQYLTITDFYPSNLSSVKVSFDANVDNPTNGVLFGCYNNASWYNGYGYYVNINGSHWIHYYSNTGLGSYGNSGEVYYNQNKIYFNNILRYTHSITTFQIIDYPLQILKGNPTIGSNPPFRCKLYYVQIYQEDELRYNLVPCYRVSDGKSAMYDLVSNQPFFNSNTSGPDFICGPDV